MIDHDTLVRAIALATSWDVPVHHALITVGWMEETDYVQALATGLGVDMAAGRCLVAICGDASPEWVPDRLRVSDDGRNPIRSGIAIDAYAHAPDELAGVLQRGRADGQWMLLATRDEIDRLRHGQYGAARFGASRPGEVRPTEARPGDTNWGFGRLDPHFSAERPMARWQTRALPVLFAGLAGGLLFPGVALPACLLALSIPFLCVAVIRLAGLAELMRGPPRIGERISAPIGNDDHATLPIYSILVPLYDEADVLPRLMRSLSALDYPAARLEILLVLEEIDAVTRSAAAAIDLPGNVRVIVVPEGGPRTKPKALNFALASAHGSFVVVYDAEDRPEPGQLRDALARFAVAGPDVVCIQARLNTYNPDAGFLTRQFTLEYTVLFDAILPALERLGLPLPLGGTSNHFKTEALRAAGAWDPYNVTEDADLGIRLARLGLRTSTIASTTWEEAPEDPGNWWRQRSRWLKDWMQTYLVHMRQPRRLYFELGAIPFAGLQVLMGGILIAVLAHPLIYVLIAHAAWTGRLTTKPETMLQLVLFCLAIANFAIGLMSSIGVGMLAVVRRDRAGLAVYALLMPAYWLMISAAGYRALVQLVRQPYLWEKTSHGKSHGKGTRGAKPAAGWHYKDYKSGMMAWVVGWARSCTRNKSRSQPQDEGAKP